MISREISRRQVLRYGLTAASGIAVASLARNTFAQEPNSIVIYSGRSENLVAALIEQFSQATGIAVEVRYGSTSEMAAMILEEGANSPADVFFSQDAGALGALQEENILTTLGESTLALVEQRFRSDGGNWVGVSGRARVAVFNSVMLEEVDLPASIKELTAASWNNKVAWAPTNGSFQSFITAFRVMEGDAAAKAWLEAMEANGAVAFENNDSIVRAVAEGELPVGLVNHYYKYEIEAEEGKELPITNHFFDGGDVGSLVNVAGLGILATAKNPDGAASFVNYLLDTDAQTYFATSTWEYPLVAGVAGPEGLTPLAELESPDIDLSDLSDLEGTLAMLTEVGLI